jgi:predicted small lipoprotein YifL
MHKKRTMRTILTAFLALTMLVMLAGPALAGASQPPFYLPTSIVLQASDPAAQVRTV